MRGLTSLTALKSIYSMPSSWAMFHGCPLETHQSLDRDHPLKQIHLIGTPNLLSQSQQLNLIFQSQSQSQKRITSPFFLPDPNNRGMLTVR
jgi:hypothetical protein